MSKIIQISSGNGGAGKSSICVSLAQQLAHLGNRVLLLELSAGVRSMDIMLGLEKHCIYDITDVLCARCTADKAVIASSQVGGPKGLHYIAGARTPFLPAEETLRAFLNRCTQVYDYIIIDIAPILIPAIAVPKDADIMALIIALPDAASVRAGAALSQTFWDSGVTNQRLIINKIQKRVVSPTLDDLDDVIDGVGVQLIGAIPFDEELQWASSLGEEMQSCQAAKAVENIACRLMGDQRELIIN